MTENPRLTFEQLHAFYQKLNENHESVKRLETESPIDVEKALFKLFKGNSENKALEDRIDNMDSELLALGYSVEAINSTVISTNITVYGLESNVTSLNNTFGLSLDVLNAVAVRDIFQDKDILSLNSSVYNVDGRLAILENLFSKLLTNETDSSSFYKSGENFIEIVYEEVSAECLAQVEDPETKICELVQKENTKYTLPDDSGYVFAYKNIDGNFIQEAVVQRCETFSVTRTEIGEENDYGETTQADTLHTYNLMMSGDVCMIGSHTEQTL